MFRRSQIGVHFSQNVKVSVKILQKYRDIYCKYKFQKKYWYCVLLCIYTTDVIESWDTNSGLFCKIDTVAFLFVFEKYCPIMD